MLAKFVQGGSSRVRKPSPRPAGPRPAVPVFRLRACLLLLPPPPPPLLQRFVEDCGQDGLELAIEPAPQMQGRQMSMVRCGGWAVCAFLGRPCTCLQVQVSIDGQGCSCIAALMWQPPCFCLLQVLGPKKVVLP